VQSNDEAAVMVAGEAHQCGVAPHVETGGTPDPAEDAGTADSCLTPVSLPHIALPPLSLLETGHTPDPAEDAGTADS
jgi:hypothetical protein